jgi:hypothetical protein
MNFIKSTTCGNVFFREGIMYREKKKDTESVDTCGVRI